MNSSLPLERLLQQMRFRRVLPYIKGDVLDFGGNRGELQAHVQGAYHNINYDHGAMDNLRVDTIAMLAVIEHLPTDTVPSLFNRFKKILQPNGRIILTTPSRSAKPVLEFLARIGLLDKHNITEHQHYWNKKELTDLAHQCGFEVITYSRFQFGFNQLIILRHGARG